MTEGPASAGASNSRSMVSSRRMRRPHRRPPAHAKCGRKAASGFGSSRWNSSRGGGIRGEPADRHTSMSSLRPRARMRGSWPMMSSRAISASRIPRINRATSAVSRRMAAPTSAMAGTPARPAASVRRRSNEREMRGIAGTQRRATRNSTPRDRRPRPHPRAGRGEREEIAAKQCRGSALRIFRSSRIARPAPACHSPWQNASTAVPRAPRPPRRALGRASQVKSRLLPHRGTNTRLPAEGRAAASGVRDCGRPRTGEIRSGRCASARARTQAPWLRLSLTRSAGRASRPGMPGSSGNLVLSR